MLQFLLEQGYASAAVWSCVYPSVCLPRAGIALKQLDESSCVLARGLPSTYPTVCCRESRASPNITELQLLEKFTVLIALHLAILGPSLIFQLASYHDKV